MGFESEFEFQEKIARGGSSKIKKITKRNYLERVATFGQQLKELAGEITATDEGVLNFCNEWSSNIK